MQGVMSHYVGAGLSISPLEEQQVLLTAEPTLGQTNGLIFLLLFLLFFRTRSVWVALAVLEPAL